MEGLIFVGRLCPGYEENLRFAELMRGIKKPMVKVKNVLKDSHLDF